MLAVKDRVPYIVIGKSKLCVKESSITVKGKNAEYEVPIEQYAAIILEPGTSLSHDVVRLCSIYGVQMFWVGDGGVRLYGVGYQCTNKTSKRLAKQVSILQNKQERIFAIRRLYCLMFGEDVPKYDSVEKYRGFEGGKVNHIYKRIAQSKGVEWTSKSKAPEGLQKSINMTNSCLYCLCEIAIRVIGYTPSIGLVHAGSYNSFSYDISDTVKFHEFVPLAFDIYLDNKDSSEILNVVRRKVRDFAREKKTIDKLINNIKFIMES